jgi:hypothetical protein
MIINEFSLHIVDNVTDCVTNLRRDVRSRDRRHIIERLSEKAEAGVGTSQHRVAGSQDIGADVVELIDERVVDRPDSEIARPPASYTISPWPDPMEEASVERQENT